jgi:hypothetical protein
MPTNLLVNGTFDTDLSGWTVEAGTWTWDSGVVVGSGNIGQLFQGFPTTPGNIYHMEVSIDNPTQFGLRRSTSGTNSNLGLLNGVLTGLTYRIIWMASATTEYIYLRTTTTNTRRLDNAAVYDLGTHIDALDTLLNPSGPLHPRIASPQLFGGLG